MLRVATRSAFLSAALLILSMLLAALAHAEVTEGGGDGPVLSQHGADDCLKCHDDDKVMGIFRTVHGKRSDPRSPFAKLQCEACHGPGSLHIKGQKHSQKSEKEGGVMPPVVFHPHSSTPTADQDAACLECHQDAAHVSWQGSEHHQQGVTCSQCHKVHNGRDPMLSRTEQADACGTCHRKQWADSKRQYAHPLGFGKMVCTDCHNAHGGPGESLLVKPSVNETCYTCHAETRGPFLWEHAPVSENCALCHSPHGSNNPALLTKRSPLLCQQCHSQAGHPSVAYDGGGLPHGSTLAGDRALLAQGCQNCHSQVHGSNHPSGVTLTR